MNFSEIVDIALPAEGVLHNLAFVSLKQTCSMQGLTKGSSDVLDRATSEIAVGSKQGFDATKKLASEGFKRPWPPLIKMDESVRKKIDALAETKR